MEVFFRDFVVIDGYTYHIYILITLVIFRSSACCCAYCCACSCCRSCHIRLCAPTTRWWGVVYTSIWVYVRLRTLRNGYLILRWLRWGSRLLIDSCGRGSCLCYICGQGRPSTISLLPWRRIFWWGALHRHRWLWLRAYNNNIRVFRMIGFRRRRRNWCLWWCDYNIVNG